MEKLFTDKEIEVYNILDKLEKGSLSDKSLAFYCKGILGNESSNESLESRLKIVEDLIVEHNKKTSNII